MRTALLGEVTQRVETWNPTTSASGQFEYIDLSAVDNASKVITQATTLDCATAPSRARQLVRAGDVLVSTVRPNLNAVALVSAAFDGATASTGFTVLRPRANLDAGYLFHWVQSSAFVNSMVAAATGASYPAVSDRIVKASPISLPALPKQRRTAAILDQADAVRTARRQVLAHLDSLPQAIFHDTFGERTYDLLPAGTVMPTMRNGVSPATGGQFAARLLTLSAITQGHFDAASVKDGAFAAEPPMDKRVSRKDFLICRGNGNKHLVGTGVCAPEDYPDLVYPDTVIAGRVDETLIMLPYLEVAWRQPAVRRQIEAVARTTNGTFKINQQTLSSVLIPVPPLDVQQLFAARTAEIAAQRTLAQTALAKDDELFAALQSRAFSDGL